MTDFQSIVLFDVQSEYPNMMIMANLHSENCSCCSEEEKWRGGGFFKVHGTYCTKQLCPVDAKLKEWLVERVDTLAKELKRLQSLEQTPEVIAQMKRVKNRIYGLKIMLNTAYGATGSAKFTSIHSLNAAKDTTGLGRQCIQYAIEKFKFYGFVPLYTDTDSVYVGVPIEKFKEGMGVDAAKACANLISKDLRERFPFPSDTFVLKYEDELEYLQFFKNKLKTELMQKHYVYLTREGKVVVKGLDVVQKTCSALSLKFWNEHVEPKIKREQTCKFNKAEVHTFIQSNITRDISILARRYNTKELDMYKGTNSLQAQITLMYGPGENMLIKNKVIGAGKGVKYCTIAEARELTLEQLDLSGVWSELEVFLE